MTFFKLWGLSCTSCGREFNFGHERYFDSAKSLAEAVDDSEWTINYKVQNGSLWDFCPICFRVHMMRGKL